MPNKPWGASYCTPFLMQKGLSLCAPLRSALIPAVGVCSPVLAVLRAGCDRSAGYSRLWLRYAGCAAPLRHPPARPLAPPCPACRPRAVLAPLRGLCLCTRAPRRVAWVGGWWCFLRSPCSVAPSRHSSGTSGAASPLRGCRTHSPETVGRFGGFWLASAGGGAVPRAFARLALRHICPLGWLVTAGWRHRAAPHPCAPRASACIDTPR